MTAPKRVNIHDGEHEECALGIGVVRDRQLGGMVRLNVPHVPVLMVPAQARQVAMHMLAAARDAEGLK